MHRKLEEMVREVLPARPKELGQGIRKLAERHSSALRASFGWRGKDRVARLELVENSVGRVGSVGGNGIFTNATDATNANFEGKDRPDTPPANATNARNEGGGDGTPPDPGAANRTGDGCSRFAL